MASGYYSSDDGCSKRRRGKKAGSDNPRPRKENSHQVAKRILNEVTVLFSDGTLGGSAHSTNWGLVKSEFTAYDHEKMRSFLTYFNNYKQKLIEKEKDSRVKAVRFRDSTSQPASAHDLFDKANLTAYIGHINGCHNLQELDEMESLLEDMLNCCRTQKFELLPEFRALNHLIEVYQVEVSTRDEEMAKLFPSKGVVSLLTDLR